MRKRLIPVALLLCLSAQSQPYARLEGDTLVLGNNLMERRFAWNGGAVSTLSLTDRTTGVVRAADGRQPDFWLTSGDVADGRLEIDTVPETALRPEHLLVRIHYSQGSVEVRREYRIFEDVPAIGCDTYLRGAFLGKLTGDTDRDADRKNIESTADMATKAVDGATLERVAIPGEHWRCTAVEFRDVTDWNNTLVFENRFIPYRKLGYRGNLLFAQDRAGGFFLLKEAPCSNVQLHYGGNDFYADHEGFSVTGIGIEPADIRPDRWTRLYGCVLGVYGPSRSAGLLALRAWQNTVRACEDMIMMNTWGDRSQDSKVNESFCLAELERAARLGMTVFQIDDGWQSGKSPNSILAKGSFRNIWDNPDYWTPDPVKYPRGLAPVADRARELGLELGLWFNPSIQDSFADWEKDAAAILGLWREYGIRIFKIDGLQIPDKKAEENLRRLFDRVRSESGGAVVFNLDATAGRRAGYHYFTEYGNVFLENRYTDWGNYYPYQTLRNLWMLSRYVPAQRLQVEFLNKWRNADKYPAGDPLAPENYRFDYLAAIGFAAQPLAWMEASNLPEKAFETAALLRRYREIMGEFHAGIILPIGEEPSGYGWTGFQSILDGKEGYLLVYRERHPSSKGWLETHLPPGRKVRLHPVVGAGRPARVNTDADGRIAVELKEENSFALYKYTLL